MATSILHDIDGTLMIEIPSSILEDLRLSVNSKLDVSADGGRIVAIPHILSRRSSRSSLPTAIGIRCTPRMGRNGKCGLRRQRD